ncbi:hypothetical protein RYH80_08215 [Halobaculum sp. MBLA0147]|uniref:hypothetical protein n=1 Tax=Halobaculum sp. MBLA0147 TaxID=3079934 RepID=UPI003523EFE9
MSRGDTYTRWGVVASGEGGNRVAAELLGRSENPGIADRVALLNTNRADVRNTVEQSDVDGDLDEHVTIFGDKRGVGNEFLEGERQTEAHIEQIASNVEENMINGDALLYLTTVGGGTGNGSVPYLVREFEAGETIDPTNYGPWIDDAVHIALGIWPYYNEPAQRQFNAMCGLSRLLLTRDGRQNADMVLLVSNSHVDDSGDGRRGTYDRVNERIVEAMDLMIGAGREAQAVIDVEDYVAQPSAIGAYHFTPAVATELNGQMLEYELMFDKAADNAFVPMDVSSARAAFAIVRVPDRMLERGDVTGAQIERAFNDWKRDNGIGGAVGMTTVTETERRGNDVDVLLLLGGFDLNPLLDHARDDFEMHKQNLATTRQFGDADAGISQRHLEDIERNLEEYVEANAR